MKKIILAVLMLVGMMVPAYAEQPLNKGPVVSDAQCKYTLADARAGLKDFTVIGFSPRNQSQDGNRALGVMMYHNPKSKVADSVDALALVLIDKTTAKELTFVVAYIGSEKNTFYKREIKADKQIGPCFIKTLEDKPKEASK